MSLLKELLLDKVNIDPENIHSPVSWYRKKMCTSIVKITKKK